MNSLATALVDKRDKLASIVTHLSVAGKVRDSTRPVRDGNKTAYPHDITYLSMVRHGISGPTFEDIALLLEDTRTLDKK